MLRAGQLFRPDRNGLTREIGKKSHERALARRAEESVLILVQFLGAARR